MNIPHKNINITRYSFSDGTSYLIASYYPEPYIYGRGQTEKEAIDNLLDQFANPKSKLLNNY